MHGYVFAAGKMEESQEVVQRAVALVLGSRGGGDTVTFQILRPGQVIGIQMTVVTTEVCDRSVSEARSLKFTLSTLSSDRSDTYLLLN